MKLLETAGKTIKQAAAAVAKVKPTTTMRPPDPWYRDDERQAEVNASGRWLARRRGGWLR